MTNQQFWNSPQLPAQQSLSHLPGPSGYVFQNQSVANQPNIMTQQIPRFFASIPPPPIPRRDDKYSGNFP